MSTYCEVRKDRNMERAKEICLSFRRRLKTACKRGEEAYGKNSPLAAVDERVRGYVRINM